MKSTKMLLVCLMLILTGSCATGSDCAWSKRITVAPDDVLTRSTKEQVVAHNRKVNDFCR